MKKGLKLPSDRSFGFTFAVVFALVGGWLFWKGSRFGVWFLGASTLFALVAVVVPRVLHGLNIVWMRFGWLLNQIVSPIVMGVIFFGIFAPVGLFLRLKGRDSLRRKYEPGAKSYWIARDPPGPDGKTLPRQF
jgi:predicted membrane metal-binding protein